MKLSVIIPFHKGESFLEECLQSLKEQQIKDMEVLLVLDGYTGKIDDVIDSYIDKMTIRVLRQKEMTGVAAARNLALLEASGEYVYFLDSDDYLYGNVLEKYLLAAGQEKADVLYGIKADTWFKREVTIARMEQEKEMLPTDCPQDVMDGVVAPSEQMILLYNREKLENISALHMMIKRSLLEQEGICFDEKSRYYADLSFVLQVLEKAKTFQFVGEGLYIKRSHNDPVHFPQIEQTKAKDKFEDLAGAYERAMSFCENREIKKSVQQKLLQYYAKTFVPLLYKSPEEVWRTSRYGTMHRLVQEIEPEIMQGLTRQDRKQVKALYHGDVKKSYRTARNKLVVDNIRTILGKRSEIVSLLHRKFFSRCKIKPQVILFESFFGKSYSDSPKYIYEYIEKNYPGKYRCIWSVADRHVKVPGRIKTVKRMGIAYGYYMAISKYFVYNVRPPYWFVKRKGMRFLQTWHGTPMKKLFFDMDEVYSAFPLVKERVYNQAKTWDYFVSANAFSSEAFRSAFLFPNQMLEFGYPRNDILYAPDLKERAEALRDKLGIPQDKKTVLYAPTWRDDEYYDAGEYKFTLRLDLQKMEQILGEEYVVLLRTHYYIADKIDTTGLEHFAYNVSSYEDISELYLISDICITDYSSVVFDYANLKRPMLFFTYDLEKYENILRGFYMDIKTELPGPLLFTSDEVIKALQDIEEITARYKEKYDAFYQKYCLWDDGHASEKVAKVLLQEKE